jgi:hypothetical protein
MLGSDSSTEKRKKKMGVVFVWLIGSDPLFSDLHFNFHIKPKIMENIAHCKIFASRGPHK